MNDRGAERGRRSGGSAAARAAGCAGGGAADGARRGGGVLRGAARGDVRPVVVDVDAGDGGAAEAALVPVTVLDVPPPAELVHQLVSVLDCPARCEFVWEEHPAALDARLAHLQRAADALQAAGAHCAPRRTAANAPRLLQQIVQHQWTALAGRGGGGGGPGAAAAAAPATLEEAARAAVVRDFFTHVNVDLGEVTVRAAPRAADAAAWCWEVVVRLVHSGAPRAAPPAVLEVVYALHDAVAQRARAAAVASVPQWAALATPAPWTQSWPSTHRDAAGAPPAMQAALRGLDDDVPADGVVRSIGPVHCHAQRRTAEHVREDLAHLLRALRTPLRGALDGDARAAVGGPGWGLRAVRATPGWRVAASGGPAEAAQPGFVLRWRHLLPVTAFDVAAEANRPRVRAFFGLRE